MSGRSLVTDHLLGKHFDSLMVGLADVNFVARDGFLSATLVVVRPSAVYPTLALPYRPSCW